MRGGGGGMGNKDVSHLNFLGNAHPPINEKKGGERGGERVEKRGKFVKGRENWQNSDFSKC